MIKSLFEILEDREKSQRAAPIVNFKINISNETNNKICKNIGKFTLIKKLSIHQASMIQVPLEIISRKPESNDIKEIHNNKKIEIIIKDNPNLINIIRTKSKEDIENISLLLKPKTTHYQNALLVKAQIAKILKSLATLEGINSIDQKIIKEIFNKYKDDRLYLQKLENKINKAPKSYRIYGKAINSIEEMLEIQEPAKIVANNNHTRHNSERILTIFKSMGYGLDRYFENHHYLERINETYDNIPEEKIKKVIDITDDLFQKNGTHKKHPILIFKALINVDHNNFDYIHKTTKIIINDLDLKHDAITANIIKELSNLNYKLSQSQIRKIKGIMQRLIRSLNDNREVNALFSALVNYTNKFDEIIKYCDLIKSNDSKINGYIISRFFNEISGKEKITKATMNYLIRTIDNSTKKALIQKIIKAIPPNVFAYFNAFEITKWLINTDNRELENIINY